MVFPLSPRQQNGHKRESTQQCLSLYHITHSEYSSTPSKRNKLQGPIADTVWPLQTLTTMVTRAQSSNAASSTRSVALRRPANKKYPEARRDSYLIAILCVYCIYMIAPQLALHEQLLLSSKYLHCRLFILRVCRSPTAYRSNPLGTTCSNSY